MAGYTAIDLSQLPAPDVVQQVDADTIKAAIIADYQSRYPDYTDALESDPVVKLIELMAYRETLIRADANDQALRVMLAYATGSDLDQLGALLGVERMVIDAGDPDAVPPVEPTYETDTAFRARIQLAPEGLSTAGPEGAYRYHALSVTGVKDVGVTSPEPGQVLVSLLSTVGIGQPTTALIHEVEAALNAEDVRPLTDEVIVKSASIGLYSISATLYLQDGPDPDVVEAEARSRLETYVNNQHRIGRGVPLSGIYGALHASGVERVELDSPISDLFSGETTAHYCYKIQIDIG